MTDPGAPFDRMKHTGVGHAMNDDSIATASVPADRNSKDDLWCILRVGSARTLGLATALLAAGYDAWTPRRTFKRPKPGKCQMIDGRKPTIEIDAPILPSFVFVRADRLNDLAAASVDPTSQLPAFSFLREAARVPIVRGNSLAGLRDEEQRAADLLAQLRETEDREARRRIKSEAATNERERRRALQAERIFKIGDQVMVDGVTALRGMSGIVQRGDGKRAIVAFGGSLTMEVETWQLLPDAVQAHLS